MSLIESIMSNFSQDTAYTKLAIHGIIEKHLKQSESKSVDDLIEKFLEGYDNDDRYEIRVEGLKIRLKEFAETLKQSEKVVEIKKYVGLCNCGEESNSKCNYCRNCGIKIKWID